MVEQVDIRQMIALCESYLRDKKGYRGRIIFDERLFMTSHRTQIRQQFVLLNELYNQALQYYKKQ